MLRDKRCTPTVYFTFLDNLAPVKLPSIYLLKIHQSTIVHRTSIKCASVEQTLRTPSKSAVCSVVSTSIANYNCYWKSMYYSQYSGTRAWLSFHVNRLGLNMMTASILESQEHWNVSNGLLVIIL